MVAPIAPRPSPNPRTPAMFTGSDNALRLSSAAKIGGEAQRMALAAGLGPIGVTWDGGQRMLSRAHHVLEVFRGTACTTVKLSDDEMKSYPDGLNKARTEAKLAAMVRELSRRLGTPDPRSTDAVKARF
jgi:hypothetical protein